MPTTTWARRCRHKGHLDEAIAATGRPSNSTRSSPWPTTTWAIALMAKGQLDEAIACVQKGHRARPEGLRRPTPTWALRLQDKGQLDEAIACYKKAIELDPKDAIAHNNLGLRWRTKGRVDEAIACYKKAIELDPKDARPTPISAAPCWPEGQLDEAIAEYRKAIELDPKYAQAHDGLGHALLAKGRVGRGHRQLPEGHRTRPEMSRLAHNNLGVALRDKGHVGRGHRQLQEGHRARPQVSRCPLQPRHGPEGQGDLDGAERAYREAVRLNGEHRGAAIDALAELLLTRGNLTEAIATYQKIMSLDPKDTTVSYRLAIVLKAKGDLNGAITAFEEVIKRQPDFAEAHFRLASALAETKQWDRSASVYAAALKRFGTDQWPGPRYEAVRSDEVFTRLTAGHGDDRLPRIMRARLRVFERDWKRAAADYSHLYESLAGIDAAKLLPEGGDDLFGYGCVLLLLGDHHGYEQLCKKWADRVGDSSAWGFNLCAPGGSAAAR